ncbi:MAG TPA: glycosyltransferase family 2 protein [Anaerolineales bacterium]|nr:glycosyltransferase family 2 protein [Anaerolineales bacterium]
MQNLPTCSIVVPVYNGAESLAALVERLQNTLPGIAGKYELILVNDGSQDQSWETIVELSRRYPWLTGINLARNYGQHNALLCGIRQAQYEIIVTMDDDLQHPPEEIVKLLKKLEEGYDVVYGIPETMPHDLWRNISSRVTKQILARIMRIRNIRNLNAFRAFRTQLREAFSQYHSDTVILDVLLSWGTTRFTTIVVQHEPRKYGKSNYTFYKLLTQTLLLITSYSTDPLRLASWLGFFFTIFGIGVFIYVIGRYLFLGYSVPGFPFLASTIAIFSGAQLFSIGIIGEYLARMFTRSMERPPYVMIASTKYSRETNS